MAQTLEGARKVAAAKLGTTLAEYERRLAAGEKFCRLCREWHRREAFGFDRSRGDGLASACRDSKNRDSRRRYSPRPRPKPGRRFNAARPGDKRQAIGRVNHLVNVGLLPPPNALPCVDCGHVWEPGERRHEYDHYLGYEAEHHEDVEAVCTICHHARARSRGESVQVRGRHGRFVAKGGEATLDG